MEGLKKHFTMTERGKPFVISADEWLYSGIGKLFSPLVDAKVLSCTIAENAYIITPLQYVGTLKFPSQSITILPKHAVFYNDITSKLLNSWDKEVLRKAGIDFTHSTEETDPVTVFCWALENAITIGLPIEYVKVVKKTSRPKGKLLFNDSIKYVWAKGDTHTAITTWSEKNIHDKVATVISGTTSLLEFIPKKDISLQVKFDILSSLFRKHLDQTRESLIAEISSIKEEFIDDKPIQQLMSVCFAIISEDVILLDNIIPTTGGTAGFRNMDRLWEYALFRTLEREVTAANSMVEYHPIGGSGTRLFNISGPAIDPDIVIYKNGNPAIIIDAKYSDALFASAGDIYQVLCYCRRLKVKYGLLVYISGKNHWIADVGTSEDGIKILAAGIETTSAIPSLTTLSAYINTLISCL